MISLKVKQGDLDDAREITAAPSELILEIIRSNNSLSFQKNLKSEIISLLSKYYFVYFLHIYLDKKRKFSKISLIILLTFKFAIFTLHCNLRTKFYNEMYKSFALIHNLIISLKWS